MKRPKKNPKVQPRSLPLPIPENIVTEGDDGLPEKEAFVEWVPVQEMAIDPRYQRPPPSAKELKKLVDEWDADASAVCLASLRNDGTYYMLDGQRRMYAAKSMGLKLLLTRVYIDLTSREEARIFRRVNKDRGRVTPLQVHHGAIHEGLPEALVIDEIVRRCGRIIGPRANDKRHIEAVSQLERTLRSHGPEGVFAAMWTLTRAWDQDHIDHGAIGGIVAFLARYPDADPVRVNLVLERVGALSMRRQAQAWKEVQHSMSAAAAWGRALVDLYNKSKRGKRLPPWESRHTIRLTDIQRKDWAILMEAQNIDRRGL
jgi:hypothetical protein